jgi:hypothetical protein
VFDERAKRKEVRSEDEVAGFVNEYRLLPVQSSCHSSHILVADSRSVGTVCIASVAVKGPALGWGMCI